MSDLEAYNQQRKKMDSEFAKNYESGYQKFKIGVMLKLARMFTAFSECNVADAG